MKTFQHKFVEFIPQTIDEGILYVSITYKTAAHKCFCGCGNVVFTPLIKGRWSLIFQGNHVSLYPSIGSANLDCRSHYFITENNVEWMRPFYHSYKPEDSTKEELSIRDFIWKALKKPSKRKKKS